MSDTLSAYLVDDDASFLTALTRQLRAEGIETLSFQSATALLDSIGEDSRGCVVADLQMPGISGFELPAAPLDSAAPMPIIFLTGYGDIPASVRAMQQGAVDFLEKRAPREDLLRAVRLGLSRGEQEFLSRSRRTRLDKLFSQLSPRELQVLEQVVEGRMNKEIAFALSIHERTVKLHRTSITRKLGVHSTAQLARLAQEAGRAEPDSPAEPAL